MFKITTAIVLLSFAMGALAQNAPIRFKRDTKLISEAVYTTTSGANGGATSGTGGTGGGNNGSGGCWNSAGSVCVPASANGCANGFAFQNPPTPCP